MPNIKHFSDSSPLPLNQDLSSSITDAELEQLYIEQRDLQHLDLYQVSALTELTLQCPEPAERHLRIQGAKGLSQIQLLGHADNRWVVHLDLPAFPHGLNIMTTLPDTPGDAAGRPLLSLLDMCWLNDNELLTLSYQATAQHDSQNWQQVHFYDLSQLSLHDFTALQHLPDCTLLILSGRIVDSIKPVFADLPYLFFTDVAGIDGLTLAGCKALTVQRAIGLRSIALLDNALHSLALKQCPQFSRLTAAQELTALQAEFTDAAFGKLELAGNWQTVKLRRSTLSEVTANSIQQLHVTDCPNLTRLRAGTPLVFSSGVFAPELLDQSCFIIDESSIRDMLQKLQQHTDTELIEAMLTQASRQYKSHNVSHALLLLNALARLNYPLPRLWQVRNVLYLQNQRNQRRFKAFLSEQLPQSWRWNIKKDRITEAYEADFMLCFAAYRQHIVRFEEVMRICVHSALLHEPAAFSTLCQMLYSEQSPLSLAERISFVQQFTQQYKVYVNGWLSLTPAFLPGLNRLARLFNALCQPDIPLCDEQKLWRCTIFDFIALSFSPKYLANIVNNAMPVMPEYVRPALLAIANNNRLRHMAIAAEISFDQVKIWYTKAALARAG